jgi:hypothetical protein
MINKLIKEQPQFKTHYGIAKDNHRMYDIQYFLNALVGLKLGNNEFNNFIKDVLPKNYLGPSTSKIENFRLKYGVDHSSLPTFTQLLCHPYFNVYNKKQTNVVNKVNKVYSANNLMALRPNRPVNVPIVLPPNFTQVVKPTSPQRVTFAPPPPLLSPNLPVLPPAPVTTQVQSGSKTLRNRVVTMKTLANLKKVAKNRKIPKYTAYKKNRIENLRRAILKNINNKPKLTKSNLKKYKQ